MLVVGKLYRNYKLGKCMCSRARVRARIRGARVRTRTRVSLLGISTGCEGTCTESVKLIECLLWGNYAEFAN